MVTYLGEMWWKVCGARFPSLFEPGPVTRQRCILREIKAPFHFLIFCYLLLFHVVFADAHFRSHDVYAGCYFLLPGREPLFC